MLLTDSPTAAPAAAAPRPSRSGAAPPPPGGDERQGGDGGDREREGRGLGNLQDRLSERGGDPEVTRSVGMKVARSKVAFGLEKREQVGTADQVFRMSAAIKNRIAVV